MPDCLNGFMYNYMYNFISTDLQVILGVSTVIKWFIKMEFLGDHYHSLQLSVIGLNDTVDIMNHDSGS